MKKRNLKNIFSAFAVVAVTAGIACAVPLAGCGKSSAPSDNGSTENGKITVIDTAVGQTYSRASDRAPIWVGPDATSGDTTNCDGSFEKPYHINTILHTSAEEDAFLEPGDTVLFKPGTYKKGLISSVHVRAKGSFNSYITFRPGTHEDNENIPVDAEKVLLDFSGMVLGDTYRGIQLYGNYLYWYNIDICGAGDNGMFVAGKYNTVEYSEFYNNRDTGLQLGREASSMTTIDMWPSWNLIKNCSSHNNYDNGGTLGENADGFAAKLTIGYGNVFDGCIAYRNVDDGWDLFAYASNGNIGTVLIANCIAYENGFLEYTRDEYNAQFNEVKDNATGEVVYPLKDYKANPYDTTRGDGNGFKLGGSVMEGDVVLMNSIAYGNKLHGVTDNSNPGFLKLKNVTAFDNNAYIDSEGLVSGSYAGDKPNANFNLARHSYSYNSISNSLSAKLNTNLGADTYRGSMTDSVFLGYKQSGSAELDTNAGINGSKFTAPAAADIFEQLPIDGTTYNLSGLGKSNQNAHKVFRNPDGSVNFGKLFKVKDSAYASLISESVKIGADLSKSSWEEYGEAGLHFYTDNFVSGNDEITAVLNRAKDALTVSCNENAVYQPFDVVDKMLDCDVTWTSENEDYLIPGTESHGSALSKATYITIDVNRPATSAVTVKLLATISYKGQTTVKEFTLKIMPGKPVLGDVSVLTQDGEIIENGGVIADQYFVYDEPTVQVRNDMYPDHVRYIDPSLYDVEHIYEYQPDVNTPKVEIAGFTPSTAGIYTITNIVTLKSDNTKAQMSYRIYVANPAANADFDGAATITLHQDGYTIAGTLGSATGTLYTVASKTELNLTPADIATAAGVQKYTYRATDLKVNFNMENNSAYYIYYALANANGVVTSQVYQDQVKYVEISSEADFNALIGAGQFGDGDSTKTIYSLTKNLDFGGSTKFVAAKKAFSAVFNGNGYTISNISVTGKTNGGETSVFYQVNGGTVMNVKFENTRLESSGDKGNNVGIVGTCLGGYFRDIVISKHTAKGYQATAGLIGLVSENTKPIYISRVYIDGQSNILGTSTRTAGIIGRIYHNDGEAKGVKTSEVHITDCHVSANIEGGGDGVSGIVGECDSNGNIIEQSECYLEITNCLVDGTLYAKGGSGSGRRCGGMLGYMKNPGVVRITGCLSIGTIYYDDTGLTKGEMGESIKNTSPVVGGYAANADIVVYYCGALFDEYETNFGVEVYTEYSIVRAENYTAMGYASEIWNYHYAEGSTDTLTAPYLSLKTDFVKA